MGKHDRRKTSGQPPDSRPVTIQVPLPVLGVVHGVREAFHGLCIATGLQVLEAMMEADRAVLCGPKGRHQVERPAWRGGSVESPVTLGGRQVEVPRLRVRSADGEVPLVSFQWAAVTDPLDEHTLAAVAAGVSTRRYAGTLDPVPVDVTERATSSSAVSRRFVALSTKRLEAFLGRPLGELDLRVVCIDGKVFRDHCMVIALGIDTAGRKHVLGLREGATETAAVTSGLLSDLVTPRIADGPDAAVRHRWRTGAAPGHHGRLRLSRRGATLSSAQAQERDRPSARAAARGYRQGVAGCLGPRFGESRGAGAGAAGRVAGARPPGRSGVHPGRTRRDADRAAPRPHGCLAANAAHDEPHREPERQRRALRAQRQAVARRPDDSTLGGERAGGGGEALPAGPGLPRSTALGLRVGRTGPARLLGG